MAIAEQGRTQVNVTSLSVTFYVALKSSKTFCPTNGRPQRDLFLEFPPPPSEEGAEFPGRKTRAMGQETGEWRWI